MLQNISLNTFTNLAIMIFAGMALGRLVKLIKLPNVTGYLLAGLLLGPSVLGLLSEDFLAAASLISDMALGFIAFSIGNEFRVSQLKKIGKQATIIGIFQAVFTTVIVDAALIGLHFLMCVHFNVIFQNILEEVYKPGNIREYFNSGLGHSRNLL